MSPAVQQPQTPPGAPAAPASAGFVRAAHLRPPRIAWVLLVVYAAALLSIGLTRDWRLVHEDNGALHSMFARAHLDLGLARTRAHDVFYRPDTGELGFYAHHPPGTSLVLAAAFALTGSDAPWLARSVAIAFHLASLVLMVALLRVHLPPALALLGGVVFATVPMSAFFGRMVNYEVVCLTGVLLQLYGYALFKSGPDTQRGFAWLALGIVVGGLADWPAFFFAAALGLAEAVAGLRGERGGLRAFIAIGLVAGAVFLFDLAHLALASGSLAALLDVAGGAQQGVVVTVGSFVERELTHGRRWFGRGALLASALLVTSLVWRRAPLGGALLAARRPDVLARWLGASLLAAVAYALAAPSWAMVHAYWGFYFLPFVVTAVVLAVGAAWESIATGGRARWVAGLLLAALLLDVGITAARTLVKRHTTDEPFALQRTRELRQDYLRPRSAPVP